MGLVSPAGADTLRQEAAKAGQQMTAVTPAKSSSTLKWTGAALFAGGMSVGLYSFIKNRNGSFAEFGEANAVNKKLGTAGIGAAFAGGTLLFLSSRKAGRVAPAVGVTATDITVSKQISW